MPQIINTNIASLNAQRNLDRTQGEGDTALERLSSGLRINSAADDAAGLAISTRFESQTQGLDVGIRNANDGVSLAQTAEGALGSMTDNLQRIRELALQSANATNSAQDRASLNEEVQELKAEIGRVSEQTNFNGTKLLDGSFEKSTFQIGANRGETVSVDIAASTPENLGASSTDGISSSPAAEQVDTINDGDAATEFTRRTPQEMQGGDLVINGFSIDKPSGDDDQFSVAEEDKSAIAKAEAVNAVSDKSGVKAVANETSVTGSGVAAGDIPESKAYVKINGVEIELKSGEGHTPESFLRQTRDAINEKTEATGVEASFSGDPSNGLELTASDGRNITINAPAQNEAGDFDQPADVDSIGAQADIPQAFGLPDIDPDANAGTDANIGQTSRTFTGSYTLISEDGSPIELTSSTGNIANAGFQTGTFSGSNSGAVSQVVGDSAMANGDLVINDVSIRESLAASDTASREPSDPASSAIAKADAINASSDATGVTATANPSAFTGGDVDTGTNETATFDVNGREVSVTFNATDSETDRINKVVDAVQGVSGQSGVEAENIGDTFRLIAEDGRNIRISNYSDTGTNDATAFGLPAELNTAGNDVIQRGSISLESAGKIEIETQGDIASSGFQIGTYGSNESGQLLRDVDISTVEGANDAITSIDNALDQVNSQRANLGSIQNRFESTIENQQVASENLQAANSRIRDADFAEESAELARTQTLQQAGISILSQANQRPQQVLQLLQG